jgi:hypothetical protein
VLTKKESYDSMSLLLNTINYNTHSWQICGDLDEVADLTQIADEICACGTAKQLENITL